MAGSHSGEDLHVRTLQGVFRRAGVSQQFLGCGSEGSPLDVLDRRPPVPRRQKPGSIRHMCSGQHASILLLCRLNGWPYEDYWRPDHPVQALYAATVARAFGTSPSLLVESTDSCGVPTYAFPLHEVARAYAMLAHPDGLPAKDSRLSLADALIRIRDAMIANPDFVAGTRDRLDSSVMKALPGRIVSKGGAEGLRGFSLLPGDGHAARGVALKIEDGGGYDRAVSAASVRDAEAGWGAGSGRSSGPGALPPARGAGSTRRGSGRGRGGVRTGPGGRAAGLKRQAAGPATRRGRRRAGADARGHAPRGAGPIGADRDRSVWLPYPLP